MSHDEAYGRSPAAAALPLVKDNNAQIGADTAERRAELRAAMAEIAAEERTGDE